jgi:hypothetical protein
MSFHHVHYADSLRWFAIAAVIALLTFGAYLGIYQMVKDGVIPQMLG